MNKVKFLFILSFFAIALNACVEPVTPTNTQIAIGEWTVKNVIANGELSVPDQVFQPNSVLHLDQNETFLFINVNGRASAGKWSATADAISLTANDGSKIDFKITYLSFDKMHVSYSFTNDLTGAVELRYLFERVN